MVDQKLCTWETGVHGDGNQVETAMVIAQAGLETDEGLRTEVQHPNSNALDNILNINYAWNLDMQMNCEAAVDDLCGVKEGSFDR